MFEITSDIPVPSGKTRQKYPWRDMKVGDSFFAECPTQNLINSASGFASRNNPNWKFKVKKENNGARIWRIA